MRVASEATTGFGSDVQPVLVVQIMGGGTVPILGCKTFRHVVPSFSSMCPEKKVPPDATAGTDISSGNGHRNAA